MCNLPTHNFAGGGLQEGDGNSSKWLLPSTSSHDRGKAVISHGVPSLPTEPKKSLSLPTTAVLKVLVGRDENAQNSCNFT